MKRFLSLKRVLLIFLFLPVMTAVVPAQGRAAAVDLEWRIISASHKKGNVDPRLRDIYRNLGAVFNYSSYTLVNMNRVRLVPNQPVTIPLSRTKTCIITLTRVSPKWVHIRIQIIRDGRAIFGTTARLMNGRMLLLGGPSSKGKALIFSLRSFW